MKNFLSNPGLILGPRAFVEVGMILAPLGTGTECTATDNRFYYRPFYSRIGFTVDAAVIQIGTGVAGTKCLIGLYRYTGPGSGAALLASAAEVDAAVAGVKTPALAYSLTPDTWYMLGVIVSGAPKPLQSGVSGNYSPDPITGFIAAAPGYILTGRYKGYGAYALPDPCPTWAAADGDTGFAVNDPWIGLRVSAVP